MENYCYFIIPNALTSEKNGLTAGERIVALPTTWPIALFPTDSEGPFLSLDFLIKNSKIYNDLKNKNSSRAHKIVQKNYIIKAQEYVLTPKGETYEFDFIDAIQHSIKGEVKNEKLTGIHFFNEKDTKIIKELEINDKGVWSAMIQKLDKNNKWIIKDNPTTFFPKEWSASKTITEIMNAEKNKVKKDGTENIYESYTSCGIKIEIVIVNGKRKTIYPIL
jgi:hypothetical protein